MARPETGKSPEVTRMVAEWVADGAATGLFVRRSHRRYLWSGPVEVLIDPGTPSQQRIVGTGQDISEGGMGLVVRQAPPLGVRVAVRYADEGNECPWVPGRVVHATATEGGYHLGVKFELE